MSVNTDLSTRVYNHKWNFDPIWRSMLDTDFYKLLMAQLIWKKHKDVRVTFGLYNRTRTVNLGHEIPYQELVNQLDHAKTVKLTRGESTWLRGNTFYGKRQIFDPAFIDWLEGYTLPHYYLSYSNDGDFHLTFTGSWLDETFWEIPALAIINELRSRSALKDFSRFEIDIVYARAKAKLWTKAEALRGLYKEGFKFKVSDFGTRRRHSFLWQRWAVQALVEALGPNFIGTSNALMAMQNDLEAIGTNAHELPMVYAALAQNDQQLAESPYEVLKDWKDMYDGNLLVVLPDTFGSKNFFEKAPDWVANWKGIRPDSMEPMEGVKTSLDYWVHKGVSSKDKLVILSDGMDIDTITASVKKYSTHTNLGIGWGTNLTNDFQGCTPNSDLALKAISLVCKVTAANGRPCVKLSDNPAKCMGPADEVAKYKKIFNYETVESREVSV